MSLIKTLTGWAAALKRDVLTVWLAARDPRVPRHAKLLAGAVAAYALSPIDLIPDFVPVLGYLDDLILVPLGLAWVISMIPQDVLIDLRERAGDHSHRPVSRKGATAVIMVWLLVAMAGVWWSWPYINHLFYPD
jgi:uncharacterized membrane protein YkvA (DUF1232 family)